jgi:geranylgeranyl diphosphate synthase type I
MMLIETATFTGYGQFNEVFAGIKDIEHITKKDIFKIYDFKTAYYTFSGPLAIGATLAGAPSKEVNLLYDLGVSLGRAFQIKDDILGLFGEKRIIGKSIMTDLQESKRTLLLWHLYRHSNTDDKNLIRDILNKRKVTKNDLILIREMIKKSDSLNYTKKQIIKLVKNAQNKLKFSRIKKQQKEIINKLAEKTIQN